MTELKCQNCRHFVTSDRLRTDEGECRFNAPHPISHLMLVMMTKEREMSQTDEAVMRSQYWPVVSIDEEGCGRFDER